MNDFPALISTERERYSVETIKDVCGTRFFDKVFFKSFYFLFLWYKNLSTLKSFSLCPACIMEVKFGRWYWKKAAFNLSVWYWLVKTKHLRSNIASTILLKWTNSLGQSCAEQYEHIPNYTFLIIREISMRIEHLFAPIRRIVTIELAVFKESCLDKVGLTKFSSLNNKRSCPNHVH